MLCVPQERQDGEQRPAPRKCLTVPPGQKNRSRDAGQEEDRLEVVCIFVDPLYRFVFFVAPALHRDDRRDGDSEEGQMIAAEGRFADFRPGQCRCY